MRQSPAQPHVANAEAAMARGDLATAMQEIGLAIQKHSNFGPAFRVRGQLRIADGATADGKKDLKRAIALDDSDSQARFLLAQEYAKGGDRSEASKLAREAFGYDPKNEAIRSFLIELGDKRFIEKVRPKGPSTGEAFGEPAWWYPVGMGLCVLSLVCFLLWTVRNPLIMIPDAVKTGKGVPFRVQHDLLGLIEIVLLPVSALMQFVWALSDLVLRRGRFLWLLPLALFPLFQAMHFLPMGVYLFIRKKSLAQS